MKSALSSLLRLFQNYSRCRLFPSMLTVCHLLRFRLKNTWRSTEWILRPSSPNFTVSDSARARACWIWFISSGKRIMPLLTGGSGGGIKTGDHRSTTENVVAGIAATAKACLAMERRLIYHDKPDEGSHLSSPSGLSRYFCLSDEEDFCPHILTFGIKGVRGEVIVRLWRLWYFLVSTTSACSSKAGKLRTLIAAGTKIRPSQLCV